MSVLSLHQVGPVGSRWWTEALPCLPCKLRLTGTTALSPCLLAYLHTCPACLHTQGYYQQLMCGQLIVKVGEGVTWACHRIRA